MFNEKMQFFRSKLSQLDLIKQELIQEAGRQEISDEEERVLVYTLQKVTKARDSLDLYIMKHTVYRRG